jgi:biopolymer transport protein ExbD
MAGGALPNRGGGIIEGINVTPLVDIMLVLLVIFIVTAKILVLPAVPMELPKATKSDDIQVVLAVSLPAEGPIAVNGQPVADDQALEAQAKQALTRDADVRAVIQADGSVPHRRVIRTLDVLRRAGLLKVAFATQAQGEGAR